MPLISEGMATIASIPDLHGRIPACRSNTFTIGSGRRPGDRIHRTGMGRIGVDVIPGENIPDLHGHIIARRGDLLPIVRPYRTVYRTTVGSVDENGPPIDSIPDLHCLVRAC